MDHQDIFRCNFIEICHLLYRTSRAIHVEEWHHDDNFLPIHNALSDRTSSFFFDDPFPSSLTDKFVYNHKTYRMPMVGIFSSWIPQSDNKFHIYDLSKSTCIYKILFKYIAYNVCKLVCKQFVGWHISKPLSFSKGKLIQFICKCSMKNMFNIWIDISIRRTFENFIEFVGIIYSCNQSYFFFYLPF